jgi:hypothetical protein
VLKPRRRLPLDEVVVDQVQGEADVLAADVGHQPPGGLGHLDVAVRDVVGAGGDLGCEELGKL